MYLPSAFEQPDGEALHSLIRAHPFATVISQGTEGPTADHIPLELDASVGEHGVLRGHVARANPLWQQAAGRPVLVVFHGPQAYVTPSWYATKALTHKVVPTWNYAIVHAHGPLQVVEDAPWLHALVIRLTQHHEAARAQPWAVGDAPPDFIQSLLRAIVGIEIPLTRVLGKFKLSQNRSAADRAGVVTGLATDSPEGGATAALMHSTLSQETPR
jgi:transcriptional regulator